MRVLLAVLLCALALPARAQMDSREAIALQNQILELRRDLQVLQQQRGAPPPVVYRGQGGGGGDIAPELLNRVLQLEEEVRRLRGDLDEQTNASRRAYEDLSKQIADLNFRLQNGGGGAASPAAPGPSAPVPQAGTGPAAPSPPVRRTPELAMQEGNAALARRDYATAEAAAREVLSAGRSTARAADANFLLAQALQGQRNYQGAAVAYDDAYNRSRTGSRAPDALLGMANALTGLNERPAACATLDKLRAEFPSLRAPIRDAAAALRGRNGCR
ncbi:MAG: hypothetical protein JOZ05_04090 [Acetobacteraceae bacterium]|nr:hypothetical protein [Acetobacteraceae bacterium]